MSGILDDLEASVSQTWNDVTSAGTPAVIAGVEAYAAQQLSQEAASNQAASTAAVNQVIAQKGPSSGIMASISQTLGQVAQGAVFKQYGLWIVVGVLGFYIVVKKVL